MIWLLLALSPFTALGLLLKGGAIGYRYRWAKWREWREPDYREPTWIGHRLAKRFSYWYLGTP